MMSEQLNIFLCCGATIGMAEDIVVFRYGITAFTIHIWINMH